jgi:hypothetical protein
MTEQEIRELVRAGVPWSLCRLTSGYCPLCFSAGAGPLVPPT